MFYVDRKGGPYSNPVVSIIEISIMQISIFLKCIIEICIIESKIVHVDTSSYDEPYIVERYS